MKGVNRFGKKGKLSPWYVGPYRILSHFRKVAYELELSLDLASIHPVFHVSLLKKCIGDPEVVVPIEGLERQNSLSYKEIPIKIFDYQIHRLRNKEVPLIKVFWWNQSVEGASLETEADMRTNIGCDINCQLKVDEVPYLPVEGTTILIQSTCHMRVTQHLSLLVVRSLISHQACRHSEEEGRNWNQGLMTGTSHGLDGGPLGSLAMCNVWGLVSGEKVDYYWDDRVSQHQNGEDVVWVVGSPGVTLQNIEKNTLNFEAKAWWALARHRLCPITGDNILSLIWEDLIAGFRASYDFDVWEFLAREMRERSIEGQKLLLAYPYLISKLCLTVGLQELSGIDKLVETNNTRNLGLIKDTGNPLSRQARRAAVMVADMFRQCSQTRLLGLLRQVFRL
ncbi:putative membrane-bound transcription factor site-2 protease-like [Capsicum annuum]|nr:putative membrane-bound transcription factor site-2 protease-like [Capsicum annuum]